MHPTDADGELPEPPLSGWPRNPLRWPLPVRILLGVALGTLLGIAFREREIVAGWTNADSGVLAGLFIRLLTTLATPLIFFAIVEAFVQTPLTGRQGAKMIGICALNVLVAFAIGLTVLNVWRPGEAWQGALEQKAGAVAGADAKKPSPDVTKAAGNASLQPLEMLDFYVPKNAVQPFAENTVLTVAVMAILLGAAMRSAKRTADPHVAAALATFERLIVAGFQILLRMLSWLIEAAPFAICLAVAATVGSLGPSVFRVVGVFFATVATCLAVHALVYYPLSAWLIGGKSPRVYLGEGLSAILTGFSINSSLATAPMTLEALRRMRVSESSARLSACVGTNFNNDGITLYEAITALFIAQAAGMHLDLPRQLTILLAALAGSMGIAGIPASGLIILALVLRAAKLPEETVRVALPIVISIDVINARLRSAVNVMGDMQVAILLDAGRPAPETVPPVD